MTHVIDHAHAHMCVHAHTHARTHTHTQRADKSADMTSTLHVQFKRYVCQDKERVYWLMQQMSMYTYAL
jgi:DNA-directed RNA polymerase subunit M/transcription elongation factor TFIIS